MRYARNLLILVVLLAIIVGGCDHRKQEILSPYGWTKTTPRFDSLTMAIERVWLEGDFGDDSLQPMIDSLMVIARGPEGTQVQLSRAYYWRGRLCMIAYEYDLANRQFDIADSLCDSAKYPYDNVRINWAREPEYVPPTPEFCQKLIKQVDILRASGDGVYTAGRLMELGTMLDDIYRVDLGLPYLKQADSILIAEKMYPVATYNQINIANAYLRQGDTVMFAKTLKKIVDNKYVKSNPNITDMVLGNLYANTGDMEMLRRAYENACEYEHLQDERTAYEAYYAEDYMKRGMMDSARYYIELAKPHVDAMEDLDLRRDFYQIDAQIEAKLGNWNEAYDSQRNYQIMTDTIWHADNRSQLVGLELDHLRSEQKMQQEIKYRNRVTTIIAVIFILLIMALLIGWYIYMRRQRMAQRALKLELELEQTQRKNLALQLAREESANMSEGLKKQIDEMREQGDISSRSAAKLTESFRGERLVRREQDNFMTTFAEIRPDFIRLFKDKYPTATESESRLAVYVVLGLDNKHIARLQGVRPESVKQARWRLRKRMNLKDGQSLEDALSNIDK